ncbi:MAG: hypothetical protein ABW118_13960 [Candidatus Thiodiazotropha sp.]
MTNQSEIDAWIHGKILADALRQQLRVPGSSLPMGIEKSFQFFDIRSDETDQGQPIISCTTCRIRKDGPNLWRVTEDKQVFRFKHQGKVFDVIMKVLATGLASIDGTFSVSDLDIKVEALEKNKTRAITRLKKEGAINTANYIQNAIKIKKNGTISIHHLKNSGWLIFG